MLSAVHLLTISLTLVLFTGIACLGLGIFLASPLRKSGVCTIPALLAQEYGAKAGLFSSIFSSIGIFLNVVGQVLAAVALLTSILDINPVVAALIAVFLIVAYVIFGGVWSAGLAGRIKALLLYLSMAVVGILALNLGKGVSNYLDSFDYYPWFSLFGRGAATDLAAAFSMLVGVVSTQTYLQAIFSGKDERTSRNGALISAVLIPPIGIAGILVGLYMRLNFPFIDPKQALPLFVLEYLPGWLGGIVLAVLLISVVGTGAGLALGIGTMFGRDIYKKFISPKASDKQVLFASRCAIVIVTALSLVFVIGNMNSLILKWSFLSMGLRGATIFFPLLGAIFFKKFIKPKAAVLAIGIGPLAAIVWAVLGFRGVLDPLYIGLFVSLCLLVLASLISKLLTNVEKGGLQNFKFR